MALPFNNVTYTFYSDTLGRSAIPDEATFENFTLENKHFVNSLYDDKMIFEREENGYDSAVCLLCEVDYNAWLIANGKDEGSIASENLGAYSYSKNSKAYDTFIEKNAKTIAENKMKWIKVFCDYVSGVN